MIGKTISHYRILEVLGEGGMGIIYRAEDTRLNRHVALKFLTPKFSGDEREAARLIGEARAAAKLDHANICTIYEIDEADGRTFLAMACIEGADLRQKIASGPLPVDEALDIATQIARGLKEAHGKGILHRDVKPANVMLTADGQVKITDFGLAELFEPESIDQRLSTSGTIAYMSPEQLRGEGGDFRSDVWALGVLLYEMLTGQRPFTGDYDQAIVYGVLNVDPEPAMALREDLAEELDRIVARALRKDPAGRYQTMEEFLEVLEAARSGTGASAESRRPIAVISFENLTGDPSYDYLRRAIPNLLITSLEQSEHLRVLTWERMRDLAKQLGKDDVETIDRDLGFELCGLEGVETVVTGSITKAGNTFATDAKVLDVATKDLLASSGSRGEGVDSILRAQIDELAGQILGGLGIAEGAAEPPGQPVSEVTTSSMEAYDCFLRGRDSFERLYNADAATHLRRALELDPDFAVAHLYLAWTYLRLREKKAGDEAFERARELSSRATRREQLIIEAAYARAVEQDREKEHHILAQIAKEYQSEKLVHHRLAGYYRAKQRFYQAVEEYNKALALDPTFGWSMNELAYMYTDVGDFDKAAEYFERYAAVSPGDANPIDSMGELCFRMGRPDCAIEKYKEALALKPDFYYAYWEIAYVSALKEDYPEALRWIDLFIEKAPSFGTRVEGLRWKCFYEYWLGRYRDALAEAQEIAGLAASEKNEFWRVEADRMRAWIHSDHGELDVSRKHFADCLDAVGRNPREFIPTATSYSSGSLDQIPALKGAYTFSIALLDIREGNLERARAALAEIEEHVPEYAETLRAEVLLAEGSIEEAIAGCEKAPPRRTPYMTDVEGMLAYNLPPLKDALARAYGVKGELYKSIGEFERLLRVDHTTVDRFLAHPRYHFRLARVYEAKGWRDKARAQYETFLEIWKDADPGAPDVDDARAALARMEE